MRLRRDSRARELVFALIALLRCAAPTRGRRRAVKPDGWLPPRAAATVEAWLEHGRAFGDPPDPPSSG
jgi:hypothetical protein